MVSRIASGLCALAAMARRQLPRHPTGQVRPQEVPFRDARLYQAEAACRFNRRFDLCAMLPRLAHALMLRKPHSEPVLRMARNFHG